jgi:hypothetical protein
LLLELLLIFAIAWFLVLLRVGLLHAFVEFIDVAEHFALFVAESFEFSFQFFTFLIGASGSKFGFELLESFVDSLLASGEFLEAIEHLKLFALRVVCFLLLLSLSFGFVTIAIIVKLQLLELLLRRRLLPPPPPPPPCCCCCCCT